VRVVKSLDRLKAVDDIRGVPGPVAVEYANSHNLDFLGDSVCETTDGPSDVGAMTVAVCWVAVVVDSIDSLDGLVFAGATTELLMGIANSGVNYVCDDACTEVARGIGRA